MTTHQMSELQIFFAVSHDIRQAQRATPSRMTDDVILHALEEIEAIAQHTDQPALRRRCDAILREFSIERIPAITA